MKKYFEFPIRKAVELKGLLTVESLDVSAHFSYPAEQHRFYEFVYVDSGTLISVMNDHETRLSSGDFLLIQPGSSHYYKADGRRSSSFFVICFAASGTTLKILDHPILLDAREKQLMAEIVNEAKNAFVFPFRKKLRLKQDAVFGAQQLVENNIEKLLIRLIRRESNANSNVRFVLGSLDLENHLVKDMITFMKKHLTEHLTLDRIAGELHYSKTFLNRIFKHSTGMPIMQYFGFLKIEEAKLRLRENQSSGTVALSLGFESTSYFSKVFHKAVGMTPTEYRRTVL